MKRHTLIYLFLCLTIVCAFAAQAQRSFRFHKSDGNMQSFFYSALDSITFSNIDLDGVSHDAVVVQEFHTPDSIYRIPLAEIDSVAFTTPPTVYKPGAVKIEGELRQYVLRADSLTLWLQAATPENIIPRQGDNIVTLDCDEILPYGFIGKVESVERSDAEIMINCAKASLFDIFEKVYIEMDADTHSDARKKSSRANVWPPEAMDVKIETLEGCLDFKKEFKPSDDFQVSSINLSGLSFRRLNLW